MSRADDPSPGPGADEERFRRLIEAGADGMLVVGLDGTIRFVNPSASELLGRPASDLVGRPFGIPVVPGETTEVDLHRPDGGARVAEMRTAETTWQGGPAHLASLRDITERKRAEEALREADRRKDEFLAMLAHELRNPLAAIGNAVELARRSGSDAHRSWSADVIDHQCRQLGRLVDDLLDVSRITRGKIQLRRERVELAPVVDRALETVRPLCEGRDQAVVVASPRGLWLEADPTRLEQVLVNLLTNAAKYTQPGGRIGLAAAVEGEEVVVRVEDNGVGIPPEAIPRMFELFAQGDRSPARSEGGLGIGLTLVRSLVEMHGGSIAASSGGPGLGSEFVVRLPAARPSDPGEGDRTSAPPPAEVRALRVLVVDDHVESAQGMASLLEQLGHEVRMAHDGPEALEAARDLRPEVVLLDIGLPRMDGYQVAERLRIEDHTRGSIIIAVSGYGQESDRARSRSAGMDHHLIKPVDIDALLAILSRTAPPSPRPDAG